MAYQLPNTMADVSNLAIFQLTATLPFTTDIVFLGGQSYEQKTIRRPAVMCAACGSQDSDQQAEPASTSDRLNTLTGTRSAFSRCSKGCSSNCTTVTHHGTHTCAQCVCTRETLFATAETQGSAVYKSGSAAILDRGFKIELRSRTPVVQATSWPSCCKSRSCASISALRRDLESLPSRTCLQVC